MHPALLPPTKHTCQLQWLCWLTRDPPGHTHARTHSLIQPTATPPHTTFAAWCHTCKPPTPQHAQHTPQHALLECQGGAATATTTTCPAPPRPASRPHPHPHLAQQRRPPVQRLQRLFRGAQLPHNVLLLLGLLRRTDGSGADRHGAVGARPPAETHGRRAGSSAVRCYATGKRKNHTQMSPAGTHYPGRRTPARPAAHRPLTAHL